MHDNRGMQVDKLTQVAGDQYERSAHAEGARRDSYRHQRNQHPPGAVAQRWLRPEPPPLEMDVVPRQEEVERVREELARRGQKGVAITSNALAVQGMPGVGKTVLAQILAAAEDKAYPGGVIWQDIGEEFTRPEQAQPLLNRWASYAFGGQQAENVQFTPAAVRALLAAHGDLLVVLDDVWHAEAIRPLRKALPGEARLLITTRSQGVANEPSRRRGQPECAQPADAVALVRLRLGETRVTGAEPWADDVDRGRGTARPRPSTSPWAACAGGSRGNGPIWPPRSPPTSGQELASAICP